MALLSGTIRLPAGKFEKFNRPRFKGRRWSWVDPLKDIQANIEAVQNGFKNRADVIGETGGGRFQAIRKGEQTGGRTWPSVQTPDSSEP